MPRESNGCSYGIHDPEKCEAIFPKRSCFIKELKRDDDSTKSHRALMPEFRDGFYPD
jgi:hypothetical protein